MKICTMCVVVAFTVLPVSQWAAFSQIIVGRDSVPPTIDTMSFSRAPSARYFMKDENSVPRAHFARVGQAFPQISVIYLLGDIKLLNTDFTDYIHFDHPLFKDAYTSPRAVYQYNSLNFANPIKTIPFTVHSNDTLRFFRDVSYEWARGSASHDSIPIVDTSSFVIVDTVEFATVLIDAGTNLILDTLDKIVMYQGTSFAQSVLELTKQLLQDSASTIYGSYRIFPARNGWIDKTVRIETIPVYYPQVRQQFADRALYMSLFYSKSPMADVAAAYLCGLAMADSVVNAQGKRISPQRALPNTARLAVYPNVISRTIGSVFISCSSTTNESGELFVFNSLGKIVYRERMVLRQDETHVTPIDVRRYSVGNYFVFVQTIDQLRMGTLKVTP
jgi:hypothetical protein